MEKITNIENIEYLLTLEDKDWKKKVYDLLGVILVPEDDFMLCSSCGYAYLTDYTESDDGEIEITSIESLVDYISRMPVYKFGLSDCNLGYFRKSELFWAIYYKILIPNHYLDNPRNLVFGLRRIEGPAYKDATYNLDAENEIWFDTSYIGDDELTGSFIHLDDGITLEAVVDRFADIIKQAREKNDFDDTVPPFQYCKDAKFSVPSTYEEILKSMEIVDY